jgi:hypothetical protein
MSYYYSKTQAKDSIGCFFMFFIAFGLFLAFRSCSGGGKPAGKLPIKKEAPKPTRR